MRKSTKAIAIVAATIVLAGTGTAAFAYWSASGGGQGSATTATSSIALVAEQTSALSPMFPGGDPQTIGGDFINTGNGPVYVTDVVASIDSVTASGACDATDFTLDNETMPVGEEVAVGSGVGSFSGATIQFNDKADANQDGCQDATVTLAFAIE